MKKSRVFIICFLIFFLKAIEINGQGNCWKEIAAGEDHSLAIKNDGTLWAWGNNISGQLGDQSNVDKKTPVQIGKSYDCN